MPSSSIPSAVRGFPNTFQVLGPSWTYAPAHALHSCARMTPTDDVQPLPTAECRISVDVSVAWPSAHLRTCVKTTHVVQYDMCSDEVKPLRASDADGLLPVPARILKAMAATIASLGRPMSRAAARPSHRRNPDGVAETVNMRLQAAHEALLRPHQTTHLKHGASDAPRKLSNVYPSATSKRGGGHAGAFPLRRHQLCSATLMTGQARTMRPAWLYSRRVSKESPPESFEKALVKRPACAKNSLLAGGPCAAEEQVLPLMTHISQANSAEAWSLTL